VIEVEAESADETPAEQKSGGETPSEQKGEYR